MAAKPQNTAPEYEPFPMEAAELERIVDFDKRESAEQVEVLEHIGLEQIALQLKSNLKTGIEGTPLDIARRLHQYGPNTIPEPPPTPLWVMVCDQLEARITQILILGATVNIILGSWVEENGWIEGVAILVAVGIVMTVTVGNDYSKEVSFRKSSRLGNDSLVKVTRAGKNMEISLYDLVVGDLVRLEPGDGIPADGVLIKGNNLVITEAALTGESLPLKKSNKSPFLFSGTSVTSGNGSMILTAVGSRSQGGKIQTMILFQDDDDDEEEDKRKEAARKGAKDDDDEAPAPKAPIDINAPKPPPEFLECYDGQCEYKACAKGSTCYECCGTGCCRCVCGEKGCCIVVRVARKETPLQKKLGIIAGRIGYVGFAAGFCTFAALVIVWLAKGDHKPFDAAAGSDLVHFFVLGVTIVVVAVPEGLPLAVTISLAFGMLKMMKEKNFVKTLSASETMGSATCICSDKTGTLTQNLMTVTASLVSNSIDVTADKAVNDLGENCKKHFINCIAINSTAEFLESKEEGKDPTPKGSPTEIALLRLLQNMGQEFMPIRNKYPPIRVYAFSSKQKRMATIVNDGEDAVLYAKGAAEIILERCTSYIDPSDNVTEMTEATRVAFDEAILDFAQQGLRTLSIAYRIVDHDAIPPEESVDGGSQESEAQPREFADGLDNELILLGIVGIKDPLRPGVNKSVLKCQRAGLVVRMVTGDKVETAVAIAQECGILGRNDGTISMEGPEFRALTTKERMAILPKLRVLARSAPEDKIILVKSLQAMGEIVAVTGDGTNDGPALRKADVGFAMGIAGTDIAKSACDIVLLDDNFNSIVSALRWGRNIFDSVRKFLQFQLSVNITSITLSFVGAIAIGDSPLSAVQLLWVNLIMDTFGALALATEAPSEDVLDRKPNHPLEGVLTRHMFVHMAAQATFQVTVLMLLIFRANLFFNVAPFNFAIPYEEKFDTASNDNLQILTYVFCCHVLNQLFNETLSRQLGSELNVYKRIFNNPQFVVIFFIILGIQVLIVSVLQAPEVAGTVPISFTQWVICISISSVGILWEYAFRFVAKIGPIKAFLDAPFIPPARDVDLDAPVEDLGM